VSGSPGIVSPAPRTYAPAGVRWVTCPLRT
jgi:hypothetical protein